MVSVNQCLAVVTYAAGSPIVDTLTYDLLQVVCKVPSKIVAMQSVEWTTRQFHAMGSSRLPLDVLDYLWNVIVARRTRASTYIGVAQMVGVVYLRGIVSIFDAVRVKDERTDMITSRAFSRWVRTSHRNIISSLTAPPDNLASTSVGRSSSMRIARYYAKTIRPRLNSIEGNVRTGLVVDAVGFLLVLEIQRDDFAFPVNHRWEPASALHVQACDTKEFALQDTVVVILRDKISILRGRSYDLTHDGVQMGRRNHIVRTNRVYILLLRQEALSIPLGFVRPSVGFWCAESYDCNHSQTAKGHMQQRSGDSVDS